MRTSNDKPKENLYGNKGGAFTNDLKALQQHVKQLEVQIKRLREMVRLNRSSNLY
jgi:hypothetical protein